MKVELKIWRYDASTGERALKPYEVDVSDEATLLDTLDAVKDKVDGSLAYRKSCRMMICGSCGMRVNGGAVLACKARISDLVADGKRAGRLGDGQSPDRQGPRRRHGPVLAEDAGDPAVPRAAARRPGRGGEHRPAEADEHDPQGVALHQLRLLRLGVQLDGVRPDFLGPAALAKGFRFVGDARDGATIERLERYSEEHGIWDCTRCYFCNERCPKGVDPRDAIAKLGAEAMKVGIDRDMGAKHASGSSPRRRRPVGCARRSSCRRRRAS